MFCLTIITSPYFEGFILLLVLLSSILLALDTPSLQPHSTLDNIINTSDLVFVNCFTLEMCIKVSSQQLLRAPLHRFLWKPMGIRLTHLRVCHLCECSTAALHVHKVEDPSVDALQTSTVTQSGCLSANMYGVLLKPVKGVIIYPMHCLLVAISAGAYKGFCTLALIMFAQLPVFRLCVLC